MALSDNDLLVIQDPTDSKFYKLTVAELSAKTTADISNDATYVEVAGSNMTGDLTLGTDQITLKADGSAIFTGSQVDFGSTSGSKIRFSRPSNGAKSCALGFDSRFEAVSDNNKFGLTNSSGGAQFNIGLVESEGSKFSVQTLNSSTSLFEEVASIDNSGSAEFAGNVKISGTLPAAPNISLNADGTGVFNGIVRSANPSDADPGNTVVTKNYLNGTGQSGAGRSYWARDIGNGVPSKIRPVNNGDNVVIRDGTNSETITLSAADGGITANGQITAGADAFGTNNIGTGLTSTGSVIARRAGTGNIWLGYQQGEQQQTSEISAAGSATFAGPLEAESIDGGTF